MPAIRVSRRWRARPTPRKLRGLACPRCFQKRNHLAKRVGRRRALLDTAVCGTSADRATCNTTNAVTSDGALSHCTAAAYYYVGDTGVQKEAAGPQSKRHRNGIYYSVCYSSVKTDPVSQGNLSLFWIHFDRLMINDAYWKRTDRLPSRRCLSAPDASSRFRPIPQNLPRSMRT